MKNHKLHTALMAPVLRIGESSGPWTALAATTMGVVQWIATDWFTGFILLLMVSSAIDWWYGRMAARIDPDVVFDETSSRQGLLSKIAGILMVFMIRWAEYSLAVAGLIDTRGVAAIVIAIALFRQEMGSLNRHRLALGGGPLPMVSRFLNTLDRVGELVSSGPQDSTQDAADDT